MAEPVENIDEHDLTDIPENPRPQEKDGHDDDPGVGAGENRWPGWPGENVYRLLVPSQNVGGIIGRKGEFIKKMVEETKARIKVLDGPPGTQERAVMVSAKEEPDVSIPPAIDALLKVHRRLIDSLDGDHAHGLQNADGTITSRLLVAATQAGSLIGKQGSTIKSIQESSHCNVRVLGQEHHLPVFALEDDKVVEVQGDPEGVHKAIELIASHLRKFLVDRSVVGLFLMHMQMPMPMPNSHMEQNMPPYQNWGPPPNAGGGGGYVASPHFMPPPRQHDNYYPPADYPPMDKSHQGLSMYGRDYGRDPPMGAHSSNNLHPTSSIVTQVTQHMQVPLAYADAVIGNAGSNISYIRRASGATITIQETRGVPGEMTVEINGTASEVQAAQQLIQNFMAEAAAGAPSQNTGGGPTDTGYNSYPSQGSMYSSPPSNAEYASHNAGHNSGGYGPVYGSNYGYI